MYVSVFAAGEEWAELESLPWTLRARLLFLSLLERKFLLKKVKFLLSKHDTETGWQWFHTTILSYIGIAQFKIGWVKRNRSTIEENLQIMCIVRISLNFRFIVFRSSSLDASCMHIIERSTYNTRIARSRKMRDNVRTDINNC